MSRVTKQIHRLKYERVLLSNQVNTVAQRDQLRSFTLIV